MSIQGLRDTSNFVTDQRPKNWRETIMLLYPNGKAPLTALTSMMKSRTVDDPEYNWWDKQLKSRRIKISTAFGAGDAVLNVTAEGTTSDGALSAKEGDVLRVEESGEIMRVAANPSIDTQIAVTRGFAGSTAAALATSSGKNPYITIIGSAYEEASSAPTGVNFDPTKRTNYTQIFRNTLEMSNTAIQTNLRTGDAVKEAKRETLEMHSIDMERAFFFGVKQENTVNGKPARTTDGLINVIDSNNIKTVTSDYASGLTMTGLETYMKSIFLYGSSEKLAFAGNTAMLTLQQVLRKNATWQFMSGIKEYGMNVSRIISPFGELVLKTHPLMNQMSGGTTGTAAYYGMDSWLWVIDTENLTYVNLRNRDTKYESKLEDNGLDGMKSGYLSEASIQIALPVSHYLLKNVVAAAVG